MAVDYAVPGTTAQGPGAGQINTLGPGGIPTTTNLPGSSPTNVGQITQSTGLQNQNSKTHQQNTSGGTSYIPDYEPQLGFLEQYGNMAGNLANQQYDWATGQFQNNSDLTNQNINHYLEQSDLASTGAQRDYANYNDMFNPAAGSLTADWQSYASPDRIAAEMGSSEAGVAHSFESQRQNAERDLQSYGLNPSDPRYAGAVSASRTAQAAASAGAGNQARINTENTGRNLRTQALQVASQLPGQVATEQNVALQGYTGAQNAALSNTSMGALTMGTTPQYLNAGVANNKFQPLGNVQGSQGTSDSTATGAAVNQSTSGPVLNTTPYSGFHYMAEGGAIPDGSEQGGGMVPASMSPSGGAQTDDIPARIQQTGGEARLNADEFVFPKDVSRYLGQKFFQDLITKSRKAMGDMAQSPARATTSRGVEHHVMGGLTSGGQVNAQGNTTGGAGAIPAPTSTPSSVPPTTPGPAPASSGGADPRGPGMTLGFGGAPPTTGGGGQSNPTDAQNPNGGSGTNPDGSQHQLMYPYHGGPGQADTWGRNPGEANYGTGVPVVPGSGGGGPGGGSQPNPQHTSGSEPGAIPTMSAYRAANPNAGMFGNGGGNNAGGRYGYGINGGPGTPAGGSSQQFRPRSSYYSPQNPAGGMKGPGWSNVTAPRPGAPPTPSQVGGGGGGGPGGGPGGGGPGGGGPQAVGGIGHGSTNNDGRPHPMMANDLAQLLATSDPNHLQSAAAYSAAAGHGGAGVPTPISGGGSGAIPAPSGGGTSASQLGPAPVVPAGTTYSDGEGGTLTWDGHQYQSSTHPSTPSNSGSGPVDHNGIRQGDYGYSGPMQPVSQYHDQIVQGHV